MAVAYVICEALALLVLWIFLGAPPFKYLELIKKHESTAAFVFFSYDWKPHPYLGFKSQYEAPGLPEISKEKPADEYWVGVFGGSLAFMYGRDRDAMQLLEKRLSGLDFTHGKKVRAFNLGHGGYKQPQQFLLYSLYGENLDLVINIEGVNETSDFSLGGPFPYEYPLTTFRDFYRSGPGRWQILSGQVLVRLIHDLHFGYLSFASLQNSPLISLLVVTVPKVAQPLYYKLEDSFRQTYRRAHPDLKQYGIDMADEMIRPWERYVTMQHQIAETRNAPLFVFLQPNQYLANTKPFSEWEKANIFAGHRSLFGPVYAKMIERGRQLREQGLPVFDLAQVFANETQDIYIDNCCHINAEGNRLLSEEMARIISEFMATKNP